MYAQQNGMIVTVVKIALEWEDDIGPQDAAGPINNTILVNNTILSPEVPNLFELGSKMGQPTYQGPLVCGSAMQFTDAAACHGPVALTGGTCSGLQTLHHDISTGHGRDRCAGVERPEHHSSPEMYAAGGGKLPWHPPSAWPRADGEGSAGSGSPAPPAHPAAEAQAPLSEEVGLMSVGSRSHAQGTCKPCCYFILNICKSGQECEHCHMPHEAPKWKRMRAPKHVRNKMKETMAAASGGSGANAGQEAATGGEQEPAARHLAGPFTTTDEQHTAPEASQLQASMMVHTRLSF